MPSINTVNAMMAVALTVVRTVEGNSVAVCSVCPATIFGLLMTVPGKLGAVISKLKMVASTGAGV